MNLKNCPFGIMMMLFGIGKTQGCFQKNISCTDVEFAEGFKFLYGCSKGKQISVSLFDNKTMIAHADLDTGSFKHLDDVMRMDNYSVVIKECRNMLIECIVPTKTNQIEDSCVIYKITEQMNPGPTDSSTPQNLIEQMNPGPTDSPTPQNLIIGVTVGVILAGIVLAGLGCCYNFWKKKQHGAAAVSGFCSCLRKNLSEAERGETEETRHPEGREVQEGTADDLDTTHQNGVIWLSEITATDPCGSDENDTEQDNTLENVHVHSIDPKADGKTPQSLSLDRNLSNKGIQPTKNGDISAPDVNRASNHQAMNSLRDDPGGVNDNKGKDFVGIREMHNGLTLVDRGPEDHGNEGQPLLWDERAAIQRFDMTGEAVALVNRRGFDPYQVRGCSTAPDTDVESTTNMKN